MVKGKNRESPGGLVVVQLLRRVRLFVTLCTVALAAPLSMRSPRQEYWSRLPFPSPGDLPNPEIEPRSLHCRRIRYH